MTRLRPRGHRRPGFAWALGRMAYFLLPRSQGDLIIQADHDAKRETLGYPDLISYCIALHSEAADKWGGEGHFQPLLCLSAMLGGGTIEQHQPRAAKGGRGRRRR